MRKIFSFLGLFIAVILFVGCEGKGKLEIDEPKGADVYINGKHVGKTPFKQELKEDKYSITVATTPYDLETKKNVQIYYDHTTKLKFKPTPKGLLEINSKPEGAEVLEGKELLGKTPLKTKIDVGTHKITLELGSVGTKRTVNIEYGKTTKLFVNLEKAVLHFNANPSDAKLIIDGKYYGTFPITVELDAGVHKITVSKPPYTDTFSLKVKKGDEFNINYVLEDVQLPPVQAYGPITFTPDHKYLVTMGKAGIYFWDLKKFKPQISLYDPKDVRNFDKFIKFAISDKGEYVAGIKPIRKLAYALKDKEKKHDKILVWDMKTASQIMSKLYVMESKGIAISKDNSKLYYITKDGVVKIADRKTGNIKGEVSLGENYSFGRGKNGKIYIGSTNGTLFVFNMSNDKVEKSVKLSQDKINDVEISRDGKYLIVALNEGKVKILNVNDLSVAKEFNFGAPILSANISPKDKKLAIGKADKTVEVYDKETGNLLYKIENLRAPVISLVFSTEDILITASSIDNPSVNIWKNGHLLKKWVQTIE